jgi:hypothetical protein
MNEGNNNDDVLVLSIKDRERMLNGHLQKILKLWQSQEWQFDEEQLIAFENGMKIGYELAYKDMSEISSSIAGVEEQVENIFKKGK